MAVCAVDHCLHTWWQPVDSDKAPALTVELRGEYTVRSARVIWNDGGMDTKAGSLPGPYGYRIKAKTGDCIAPGVVDFKCIRIYENVNSMQHTP